MKTRRIVALVTLFAMVIGIITSPTTTKAEEIKGSEITKTITCNINGINRNLLLCKNKIIYFKIGDANEIPLTSHVLDIGFDINGVVWMLDGYDNGIRWWNYDFTPNSTYFSPIKLPAEGPYAYVDDVESLIRDENNEFIVGYKTFSGETYPILTLDEMKKELEVTDIPGSRPSPSPDPISDQSTGAGNSNVQKPSTEREVQSPIPAATVDNNTSNNKVSITKNKAYKCLSVGNTVVSKYKLKKGTLSWKAGKKKGNVKKVKCAAFIKKSKNIIYVLKNGRAYTISLKGKKKCILKKGAKKLVLKDGFAYKIKKKSGSLNVTRK